jgi:hypothetical protein
MRCDAGSIPSRWTLAGYKSWAGAAMLLSLTAAGFAQQQTTAARLWTSTNGKQPTLKPGGLSALLDGESAESVGVRIESALSKDLGIRLTFE